ncbi:MAG TPA: cyclic nucleotide-binding domain-containing protein [Verrucomicrobiae bacterium]|nr:cyclic nucleotide-binding domain-containing protein [Verrucomicrobiae bacterium]
MNPPRSKVVAVRRAAAADCAAWLDLVRLTVGDRYIAPQIYAPAWAAEQLSAGETWVAEIDGTIGASVSILTPFTRNDNPVSNLGRHFALPEHLLDGAAEALLRKINEICAERRQMAILRVPASDHPQQLLLEKLGFVCIGFQPAKHVYRDREAILFYVRIGAPAAAVRLPLSQSLPQIVELASAALKNLNISNPEIVRDGATGYPVQTEIEIQEATPEQFELQKLQAQPANPPIEISGQFNRGFGLLRIPANAPLRAVLGARGGRIVAGLTFYFDEYDLCLRLVDSFSIDELSTGAMLQHVARLAQSDFRARYLEVDFLITAPRALKSAEQLGFVPVAYLPGMYKRGGCCVDLVKMVKLDTDYAIDKAQLTPHATQIVTIVDRIFQNQKVGFSTITLLRSLAAFNGLGDGELGKLASLSAKKLFRVGETIFQQGDAGDEVFVVIRGKIEIFLPRKAAPVSTVSSGELFGEQAFLDGAPRTATALAAEPTILLVIQRSAFGELIQTEPHLGVIVMRNIAQELSRRLRHADVTLGGTPPPKAP